jgi:hypothetical protein
MESQMGADWEAIFHDAVLETDYSSLSLKIDSAVTVLCARLFELRSLPEHLGERHRIVDALQTLHMIRRIDLAVLFEDRASRTVN